MARMEEKKRSTELFVAQEGGKTHLFGLHRLLRMLTPDRTRIINAAIPEGKGQCGRRKESALPQTRKKPVPPRDLFFRKGNEGGPDWTPGAGDFRVRCVTGGNRK